MIPADAAGESSKLHISGAPCGIANLPRSQKNKIVNTNSVLLKESCHQDSDSADNVTDGNCSEFYKKMNSGYQAQESSPQSAQQSIEENVDSSDGKYFSFSNHRLILSALLIYRPQNDGS